MQVIRSNSFHATIWIAGDIDKATVVCRDYCDNVGLCVSISTTEYVYTHGQEKGIRVDFINYPRFPSKFKDIKIHACRLGILLKDELNQESFSIECSDFTYMYNFRKEVY